jgi:hypothetical protein
MDQFAGASGRFSREEEADEEQEDASNSPRREISFMPTAAAATTASASSSAAASASASTSASASASGTSSAAPFRSASGDGAGPSGSGAAAAAADVEAVEKEHMFDKVVTPSDVGKLNRLVIPKQYAEKYFPLDAAGSEKGLLLGFEDTAGKQWRFRYSYWNSSQSYVMTKGWSRFVKEKRLVAGDTVSFSRAVADDAPRRLFIDWKRRVDTRGPLRFSGLALPMPLASHHYGPHHYSSWGFGAGAGGGGGFFLPPPPPATLYEHHRLRQGLDFRGMTYPAPTVGRQLLFFGSARSTMPPHAPLQPPRAPAMPLHYTLQPSSAGVGVAAAAAASRPVVLDSVPVIESPTTAAKRVRLFGVNLDNNSSQSDGGEASHQGNALSLQMPGWQQRSAPTLRLLELPRHGAESSAASSPSSSSSSKREARSALDLDL